MGLKAAVQALKKAEPLKDKVQRCKDLLTDNDAWICQQQLQRIYQRVLILDLEYALDRKVEQELWNLGFKNYIAMLQSQAKDRRNPKRGETQALLSWCLEAASGFYLTLLQEICTAFDLDLPFRRKGYVYGCTSPWKPIERLSAPHRSSCFYACQYCLVHLGDIARYRNESRQAELFYRHAVGLSPSSGQPYNQLALLEASRGNKLATVFNYTRSVSVKHPFPVATANLSKTLSSALNDNSFDLEKKTKLNSQEYILVFLKFHGLVHNLGDLKLAASYVKVLTESLTALVATESFGSWALVQMFIINLFALQHVAGDTTELYKSEELSWDETAAMDCILDLIAGTLSALLLPVYTIKNSMIEYFALPSIKLCLEWIGTKPYVLEESAFASRLQIWPSLCVLLNALQESVGVFNYEQYTKVPLPEDRDLQGFLPLEKAFEGLRFSSCDLEDNVPKQNLLRAARILRLGFRLARQQANLIQIADQKFVCNNEAGPSNELMKELEELSLNKEKQPVSESPVLSQSSKSSTEADTENNDKRMGILKPQGSLERSRDSEGVNSPEINSVPSIRKTRQNIAMQTIMRRAENEQKQVTFKNVSPIVEEEAEKSKVSPVQSKNVEISKVSNVITRQPLMPFAPAQSQGLTQKVVQKVSASQNPQNSQNSQQFNEQPSLLQPFNSRNLNQKVTQKVNTSQNSLQTHEQVSGPLQTSESQNLTLKVTQDVSGQLHITQNSQSGQISQQATEQQVSSLLQDLTSHTLPQKIMQKIIVSQNSPMSQQAEQQISNLQVPASQNLGLVYQNQSQHFLKVHIPARVSTYQTNDSSPMSQISQSRYQQQFDKISQSSLSYSQSIPTVSQNLLSTSHISQSPLSMPRTQQSILNSPNSLSTVPSNSQTMKHVSQNVLNVPEKSQNMSHTSQIMLNISDMPQVKETSQNVTIMSNASPTSSNVTQSFINMPSISQSVKNSSQILSNVPNISQNITNMSQNALSTQTISQNVAVSSQNFQNIPNISPSLDIQSISHNCQQLSNMQTMPQNMMNESNASQGMLKKSLTSVSMASNISQISNVSPSLSDMQTMPQNISNISQIQQFGSQSLRHQSSLNLSQNLSLQQNIGLRQNQIPHSQQITAGRSNSSFNYGKNLRQPVESSLSPAMSNYQLCVDQFNQNFNQNLEYSVGNQPGVNKDYQVFRNSYEDFNFWKPPQPPVAWWNSTKELGNEGFQNWNPPTSRIPNYQQNQQINRQFSARNNYEDTRQFEEPKSSQSLSAVGISAGNTYSLFSGNTWTHTSGQDQVRAQLNQQSLWSGPGPSPLERLLEQQKSLREGGT